MSQSVISNNYILNTRSVYDKYAGMLLGYIYEVVKDKQLAEQYLVSVFSQLPEHFTEHQLNSSNIYIRLQLFARKLIANNRQLQQNGSVVTEQLPQRQNKYLQQMESLERNVFCSVYFDGKSISEVAIEMGREEQEIRKILQQSFKAIRRRDV